MIQTDASKSGWGAFCNGVSTGRKWSEKEENLHINVLKLITAKFAILTFTALSYLLKMRSTHNKELLHTASPFGVAFSANKLQCLHSTFPML